MTRLAKTLFPAALGLGLTLAAGSTYAQTCGVKGKPPCPSPTDLCHNIGGPQELGANFDAASNSFIFTDNEGNLINTATLTVPSEQYYLGIIISANTANPATLRAHLGHGDGFVVQRFLTPLHQASEVGPHQTSNVECLAIREEEQPDEPGN